MSISTEDHRKTSLESETTGKRYRVRDRNDPDPTRPVKVWGENLTFDQAHKLKEQVVGSEWSSSARIEEMTEALTRPAQMMGTAEPANDPFLEEVRRRALAAARPVAAQAQQRADVVRDQILNIPQPPTVDLTAGEGDVDAPFPELEGDDEAPSAIDAETEAMINVKAKALYDAYAAARKTKDGVTVASWDNLSEQERAGIAFEALYEQGPHFTIVAEVTKNGAAGAP